KTKEEEEGNRGDDSPVLGGGARFVKFFAAETDWSVNHITLSSLPSSPRLAGREERRRR
ncbi:hypothetical protein Tsubulata_019678, partial [Turnera subulata]